MKSISPETLGTLLKHPSDALFLDVRATSEFNREHAIGAVSLPLHRINAQAVRALSKSEATTVYVLCQRGYLARLAVERLQSEGFHNAVHVEGGTDAWINAKLPHERHKPVQRMSNRAALLIEILAIAAAFLLGITVHIGFFFALLGVAIGFGAFHDWSLGKWLTSSRLEAGASS